MNDDLVGIVVGRFQPLCNNHKAVFDFVKEDTGRSCFNIVVGRPNYDLAKERMTEDDFLRYQVKNIFSFDRTKDFLQELEPKAKILPFYDIFDSENYGVEVLTMLRTSGGLSYMTSEGSASDFINVTHALKPILYGDNKWTLNCFVNHCPIMTPKLGEMHATEVRNEIMLTGKSEGLVSKLTPEEMARVAMCQYILSGNNVRKRYDACNYEILEE